MGAFKLSHDPSHGWLMYTLANANLRWPQRFAVLLQIMAVASFFSLIFISLFTEQLSQRKMWLAPDELRPKLAAAWAVIVAIAARLRARCTCF